MLYWDLVYIVSAFVKAVESDTSHVYMMPTTQMAKKNPFVTLTRSHYREKKFSNFQNLRHGRDWLHCVFFLLKLLNG